MRYLLLAAAFLATLAAPASALELSDVYRNARFGYTVCYSAKLFVPQPESENGDGRAFVARDGAELRVWGHYNVADTLAQYMDQSISWVRQDGGTVTYKAGKENWFVISGEQQGRIYYQRTIGSGDRLITFRLTYDRDLAGRYDPVIRQLNGCLHE